ncbi:hypothetical protein WJX81_005812 [Elliptochloris bilobata]|uniref:Protein kinase domain-containing protein n=1 Tax=Elliptochloris bilobata TaxID=381761 RepID=A0AAW1QMX3_9CHLO
MAAELATGAQEVAEDTARLAVSERTPPSSANPSSVAQTFTFKARVPYSSAHEAEMVCRCLDVDRELRPEQVTRRLSTDGANLLIFYSAVDARTLRAAAFDSVTGTSMPRGRNGVGLKVRTARKVVAMPLGRKARQAGAREQLLSKKRGMKAAPADAKGPQGSPANSAKKAKRRKRGTAVLGGGANSQRPTALRQPAKTGKGRKNGKRRPGRRAPKAGGDAAGPAPIVGGREIKKWVSFAIEDLKVKNALGEGSYGQVFEGFLRCTDGSDERVVLKRVKRRVEGAEEMNRMEHLLNVYAARSARGAVADFLGYCEVARDQAFGKLTEGVWLVWRYEGSRTLAAYLRRRDCLPALSRELGVPAEAVAATVLRHILEGLAALHAAGVVHRDVKPLNVIFAEEAQRFKLIDLGAAADLRTGTNYQPDESILDPTYAAPEQFCLPTDSPHLARHARPLAMAMSPLLWGRHKPDLFDSYSAGLVFMQLAVPRLRPPGALRAFREAMNACGHDLAAWRARERPPPAQTAALDAGGGAGWDLAASLLRPRRIAELDNGGVVFIDAGRSGAARMSATAALKHRFIAQAAAAAAVTPAQAAAAGAKGGTERTRDGALGSAIGIWRNATRRLMNLEAQIVRTAEEVEVQTTRVKILEADVATGRAPVEVLQEESSALQGLKSQLIGLTGEFGATARSAQSLLSGLFSRKRAPAAATAAADAPPAPERSASARRAALKAQPAAAAPPAAAAAAAAAKALWPTPPRTVNPYSAAAVAAAAGDGGSDNRAVAGVYTALKFGGLALRVASGLAASIGRDAEKALAQLEPQPDPRRVSREVSSSFMDMLREEQAAVEAGEGWTAVSERLQTDLRFQAAPEARREQMFDTFREAVAKVTAARARTERAQAGAAFAELLEEAGIPAEAEWPAVVRQLGADPRWQALPSDEERRKGLGRHCAKLRAEAAFARLLDETPGLTADTPWPLVKRKVWSDPRHAAVPEARRTELWREFRVVLAELSETLTPDPTASPPVRAAANERVPAPVTDVALGSSPLAAPDLAPGAAGGLGSLTALQAEQARLQLEYAKMEAKLREMEARLTEREEALRPPAQGRDRDAKVAADRDGAFVFRVPGGRARK